MKGRFFFLNLLALLLGSAGFFFMGVHYDPEFGEPIQIVKKHPSLHFAYRSPIGESDRQLTDLTSAEQQEEIAFRTVQSGENINDLLSPLQPLPLQVLVSLLVIGVVNLLRRPHVVSFGRYAAYFLLCLAMQFVIALVTYRIESYLLRYPAVYYTSLFVMSGLLFLWLTRHSKVISSTWTTSTTPS